MSPDAILGKTERQYSLSPVGIEIECIGVKALGVCNLKGQYIADVILESTFQSEKMVMPEAATAEVRLYRTLTMCCGQTKGNERNDPDMNGWRDLQA